VFLAFDSIDFFQRKESPVDFEASESSYLSNPEGGLIGIGTHQVEVKIDRIRKRG